MGAPVVEGRNESWCEEAERLFHLSMQPSWKLIETDLLLLVTSHSDTSSPSVRNHPGPDALLPASVHQHMFFYPTDTPRQVKTAAAPVGEQLVFVSGLYARTWI